MTVIISVATLINTSWESTCITTAAEHGGASNMQPEHVLVG